jgi:3-oxoacyl-[acyl-carrier-protein] synthase-3
MAELRSRIKSISYALPSCVLGNEELAQSFPEWPANQIQEKLGISERRIAGVNETSSDLAVAAAEKLFADGDIERSAIDYIIFCTQTPDYILPTSACIIQDRLKIPNAIGALDFNLGCSGYVYGLGIAKGLIETGQARNVLFLTGETYSKLMRADDKSTRTLFGDAGSATVISLVEDASASIGPFVYGTDGGGCADLIVKCGGSRSPGQPLGDGTGLCMDGPKIFNFSIREVAPSLTELLQKAGLRMEEVSLFVFHQANKYMLEFLQRKCCIPAEKFYTHFANTGNTVSNTIPIALYHAIGEKKISKGEPVVLMGFGVGLSWAACIVRF